MDLRIDRATPADAPGLTTCIDAAYAGYRAQGIDLPPVSEGVAEDIARSRVWVARDGAAIVGGLILSLDGAVAYLQNVAVHPDHGGRGIGRALVDNAVRHARASNCTTVRLTTHVAMPDNVALYRHLGWQVTRQDSDKVFMSQNL